MSSLMIKGPAGYDPVLGEMRTNNSDGGGGGGSAYGAYVYGVDRDAPDTDVATDSHRVILNTALDYAGADPAARYARLDDSQTFAALPAHDWRRCIVSDLKNQTIYAYLNAGDSRKKADGTALTEAELRGDAGDFLVHQPKCYWREDTYMVNGVKRYVYLCSVDKFLNSFGAPWFYSGPGGDQFEDQFPAAFPSVVCNADGSLKEQTYANVPASLGGTDVLRSIPGGRPAVSINRTNFRNGHARAGGLTAAFIEANPEYDGTVTSVDDFYFQYLIRMMMIEFNALDVKTALSAGFAYLKAYRYDAQRLTGRTLSLGNASGEIKPDDVDENGLDYDLSHCSAYITASNQYDRYPDGDADGVYAWKYGATVRYTASETPVANTDYCYTDTALTAGAVKITAFAAAGTQWNNDAISHPNLQVVACSYRGIENPYAALWCNADGIQKYQDDTEADITSDGVVFERYIDGDYINGSFHSYAWINGETVIYTTVPHPAVNAKTYSDKECTTDRSKNVTAWDEDYSQSGYWTTNDSRLYYRMDTDMGYGSINGKMPDTGYTGNQVIWVHHPWPKAGGYAVSFDPETFFPTKLGGSANKGLCAYFYNDTAAGARLVLRGGVLPFGAYVSPAFVYVSDGLTYADTRYGSRLAAHRKMKTE